MEEKILESIVSVFVKELTAGTKLLFSDIGEEVKQIFNRSIKKYLEKQRKNYSHLKTLLKGNSPVYLYDIYYPLKIKKDNLILETNSISKVFGSTNYVTLIGDAGSGKSTLIKHLFLTTISEKYAIPVLIELRYLNDYKNSFEEYIYEKIFENKLSDSVSLIERLLTNGRFVFFLDGFDELNGDKKSGAIASLANFINTYDQNKFLITTRPYSDIENLPLFHNYQINNLSWEFGEIEGFIHKQLQESTELAKRIVNSIKGNRTGYIDSFLANPLLLSLYILTFQSDASIPSKKYIFYRRVINALFSEHDSKTKLGYVREKQAKLTQEQFEEVLKLFSFLSFFENKFNWDNDYANTILKLIKKRIKGLTFENALFIKDLKSAIALWIEDHGIISFTHRSLQEYFCALFIKDLGDKDGEVMYSKIITLFADFRSQSEYKNLLSLCEEMDEVKFRKYYRLPLLRELQLMFVDKNEEQRIVTYLQYFAKGIVFDASQLPNESLKGARTVEVRNSVYRAIYLHLTHTQKLFDFLRSEISVNILKECAPEPYDEKMAVQRNSVVFHEKYGGDPKWVNFQKSLPSKFLEGGREKLQVLANDFVKFIDSSIANNEEVISNSETTKRDFINMIDL